MTYVNLAPRLYCSVDGNMRQLKEEVDMSERMARYLFSTLVVCVCFGCGGSAAPPSGSSPLATFTRLGFLASDVASQANAVSADGLMVVGSSQSASGKSRPFRWRAEEGMVDLGLLHGGTTGKARAVSANGDFVVGDGDVQGSSSAVFRWSKSTGLVQLKALSDSTLCAVGGVSGDGNVVVGTCLVVGNSAFRWTESSGMVALGQFGGGSSRSSNALAISSDAGTVVGIGHPVLTGAMIWHPAGEVSLLGTLPGDVSAAATAVSRNGGVVVGYSTDPSSHQRAFRWTQQSGMVALPTTTDQLYDVIASATSGDGQLVVGWGNMPTGETALVWDELHGMRRLDDVLIAEYQTKIEGWSLSRATAVSDDGRTITGFGITPEGRTEAWIVSLPK